MATKKQPNKSAEVSQAPEIPAPKRKYKQRVTLKGLILKKKLDDNMKGGKGRGKSFRQLAIEAGYSESKANRPSEIPTIVNWREDLAKKVSDGYLNDILSDQLKAVIPHSFDFPQTMEDDVIYDFMRTRGIDCYNVVKGYGVKHALCFVKNHKIIAVTVDQIVKMQGKLAPAKIEIDRPFKDMPRDELDKEIERLEIELGRIKSPAD